MILEFSIENYRSFKDKQTLSLIPSEGKPKHKSNIFILPNKLKVLKTAAVYGANASGKSNLMKAMKAMRNMVLYSAEERPGKVFSEYDPFQFNIRSQNAPTNFEISFLLKETRYQLNISILKNKILREELYFYPQGREAKLYIRNNQEFEFGDYLKGKKVVVSELTSENQLYLSKAALNNISQLVEVFQYFNKDFMTIPFLEKGEDGYYTHRIAEFLNSEENSKFSENFYELLSSFDTGILNFKIEKKEFSHGDEYEILVEHKVFNDEGMEVGTKYHSISEESMGTQKLFVLGGIILRALMNGRVIIIDEFERSLHPLITRYIIKMFHNEEINTKGAQLIIATHDTHLLNDGEFMRDQIWIVEKNQEGASELFSLSDINGVRPGIPFEKWYLSGRFGGIPGISNLNFELNFHNEKA